MITFKQYITELFDKPYKWRKFGNIDVSKLNQAPKLQTYNFNTDDGRHIVVDVSHFILSNGKHITTIEFNDESANKQGQKYNPGYDLTGEGDAMRIMSTVLDTIKDMIKTTNPDMVRFSADKQQGIPGNAFKLKATGRVKLYKTMVKRFAGKLGYTLDKANDDGSSIRFNLIRKK
jgi:hypothetical protein